MAATFLTQRTLVHPLRAARRVLLEWWHLLHLSAVVMVLAISPSSYSRSHRAVLARHLYSNTAPILLSYTLVCALVTVVLTRIVLVTALSYGLSQYAMQLVIRVLVLELIPLTAALFVALRCTIPDGAELLAMHANGQMHADGRAPVDSIRREILPRAVAGLLSGTILAALSSTVVLIVAYVSSYGFSLSSWGTFVRLFGQVFNPAVTLIFFLKTLFFCLTVSLIPMASALYGMRGDANQGLSAVRTSAEMRGLVRMFAVILLNEMVSLVGN